MIQNILQVSMAVLGAIAYSLLFNIRRNKLVICGIFGGLTWVVYLICAQFTSSVLLCNIIAAAFATLISEISARVLKAPTTCFLIPAVIPLIPGGGLYYTMYAAISKNISEFESYLSSTVQAAFGISLGIIFMSLVGIKLIRKGKSYGDRFIGKA